MTAYEIIDAKKRGEVLTEEQIRYFIGGVADNSITDAQIAAFCMAVILRGMTDEESFILTDAMAHSGDCAKHPNDSQIYADKHSTGGVSDSTTLILVPILASLGVKCAKYSGRGLGHTGGTLDKIESFPGLTTQLSVEQFQKQAEEIGGVIAGQTQHTVPADRRMYAVRDVTATIESIPLIASSVMSKKLASFADIILLDVKYGNGAFMHNAEDAVKLAKLMVSVGNAAGRTVGAAVTCMDVPLGDSIGCNAEVREVIEVLRGKKNFLSELSVFLSAKIIQKARGCSEQESRTLVEGAIASGAALRKFKEIVAAQGGDVRAFDDFALLPFAKNCCRICAKQNGQLKIDALALGKSCAQLGGGRQREDDEVDHSIAILLKKHAGDRVQAGDLLAEVYYNKENKDALSLAENAFCVCDTVQCNPLVLAFIDADGSISR